MSPDSTHAVQAGPEAESPRPGLRRSRLRLWLASSSSLFLGLALGAGVAALLEILLLPRHSVVVLAALGVGLATSHVLLAEPRPRIERGLFRPVWCCLAAGGFLVADAGLVWLIMQLFWR